MKRQSPAISMNFWIAHGPASFFTTGWSSVPSSQNVSAERNEKSTSERNRNTTGSAGWCGVAHESTVLVVPKSRPRARGPARGCVIWLAHRLDAGLLELLAQLRLDRLHGLGELGPGNPRLLELVVGDVLLPGGRVAQLLEAVDPVGGRLGRLLGRGHDAPDLRGGRHVESCLLQRGHVGIAGKPRL